MYWQFWNKKKESLMRKIFILYMNASDVRSENKRVLYYIFIIVSI